MAIVICLGSGRLLAQNTPAETPAEIALPAETTQIALVGHADSQRGVDAAETIHERPTVRFVVRYRFDLGCHACDLRSGSDSARSSLVASD